MVNPVFKLIITPIGNRQKETVSDRYRNKVMFLKIEFDNKTALVTYVINKESMFSNN